MKYTLTIEFPPTPNGVKRVSQDHDTREKAQAEAALWLSDSGIKADKCFINGSRYAPQMVIDWKVATDEDKAKHEEVEK